MVKTVHKFAPISYPVTASGNLLVERILPGLTTVPLLAHGIFFSSVVFGRDNSFMTRSAPVVMISFTLLISGGRQRIEVEAVFRVSRLGEAERLKNCGVPGNHRLLWHGTNTANMIGILQQGLRIAPPEASRSGWSLGKVCVVASASCSTLNVATHMAKREEDCSFRFYLSSS